MVTLKRNFHQVRQRISMQVKKLCKSIPTDRCYLNTPTVKLKGMTRTEARLFCLQMELDNESRQKVKWKLRLPDKAVNFGETISNNIGEV